MLIKVNKIKQFIDLFCETNEIIWPLGKNLERDSSIMKPSVIEVDDQFYEKTKQLEMFHPVMACIY